MSPFPVALCYGSAMALSLFLLWYFGVKHWYWHLLSLLAAVAIGLAPTPEGWNTPTMTLFTGWVFLFLFLWGVAAPLFAVAHLAPHAGHHHPH